MGCGRRECRGGEGCGWQRIRRQLTERQRKWQCVLFCTLFHILICILFHVPFYILLGHTFYFLLSISFSTLFSVLILRKLIRSNCLGISNQAVCYSFVFSISFSILFSVLFSIQFSIAPAPADCCVPFPLPHPSPTEKSMSMSMAMPISTSVSMCQHQVGRAAAIPPQPPPVRRGSAGGPPATQSGVPHAVPSASIVPCGHRLTRFLGPARSPPRPAANAAHSADPDRATPPRTCHPIRRSPRLLRGRPALPADVHARPSSPRAPSPGGRPPRTCTSSLVRANGRGAPPAGRPEKGAPVAGRLETGHAARDRHPRGYARPVAAPPGRQRRALS